MLEHLKENELKKEFQEAQITDEDMDFIKQLIHPSVRLNFHDTNCKRKIVA